MVTPKVMRVMRNAGVTELVRAAQPEVKRADPGAEIVIGELAPVGNRPISADTPMRPLAFLRSFGCVDDRYKSVRTGDCRRFKAPKGDTLGYHFGSEVVHRNNLVVV